MSNAPFNIRGRTPIIYTYTNWYNPIWVCRGANSTRLICYNTGGWYRRYVTQNGMSFKRGSFRGFDKAMQWLVGHVI